MIIGPRSGDAAGVKLFPESQSMHHLTSSRLDFSAPQPVSLSDLPPRIAGAMQGSNGDTHHTPEMAASDIFPRLTEYPWFHGMLSRTDAAAMVLHHSVTGKKHSVGLSHWNAAEAG